jgi:hypothetical protein
MAFIVAPDEHQRHRVIIEVNGPVDRRKWARYRKAVKAVVKRYGADLTVLGRSRKARRKKKK